MALLIAALALLFPLFGFIALVLNFSKSTNPVTYGLLIGVCMSGIAFGLINTSEYSDLARFMDQAMLTQGLSPQQSLDLFSRSHISDTPLAIMWFWLVGQTGIAQLYPASIAFVEYAIIGYIFTDYAVSARFKRGQYLFLLGVLAVTLPLFDSVGSVRSTPALALAILAIYLEYCKSIKHPLVYTLYIIPIFIHSIGFIAIPLRLLCVLGGSRATLAIVCSALMLPAAYALSSVLDPVFSSWGFSVMSRVQTYVAGGESEYAQHVAEGTFFQIKKYLAIALGLVSAFIMLRVKGRYGTHSDDVNARLSLIGGLLCGLIASFAVVVVVPSYARFLYTALPICALCVVGARMKYGKWQLPGAEAGIYVISQVLFWVLIVAMFALSMFELTRRISMSGLLAHVLLGYFGYLIM